MALLLINEKIRKMFKDIIAIDKKNDELRAQLFFSKNFTINGMFTSIDKEGKQYINLKDLLTFLNENKINFKEEMIRRVIHCYDKTNSFCINYENFTKMIMPRYSKQSDKDTNNDDINLKFAKVLESEVNLCEEISNTAKDIKNTKEFTTYESFIGITTDKYITKENLHQLLNEDDTSLQWVIYRFDNDNDGMISYEEFQDIFFPFQEHLPKEDLSHQTAEIKDNYYSNDIVRCVDTIEAVSPPENFDINKAKEEIDDDYEEEEEEEIEHETQKQISINTLTVSSEPVREVKQIQTPLISSTYQILSQSKCSCDNSKANVYRDSKELTLKRTEYTITLNLIDYITNLISLETNTETLKESLALQNDISFPDLFFYFDISKTNTITISDMISLCKSFAFFPSIDEVRLIFKRFSSQFIDELSFEDFANMIAPLKTEYRRLISKKHLSDEYIAEFSFESKQIVAELIQHMVFAEKFLTENRMKINTRRDFSCIDAWGVLSRYSSNEHKETITAIEMKKFLESNGFYITNFELSLLVNKFDHDNDGVITYYDFAKEILN